MAIRLTPPLTAAQANYLTVFADTRRMTRNEAVEEEKKDPIRKRAKLPVGREGEFVVHGEEYSRLVVNSNRPPAGQPSLWCSWKPSADGRELQWENENDREDAYQAGAWLKYIAEHILAAWGVRANGVMSYRTVEETGVVVVQDNDVREPSVEHTYVDPWSGELVVLEELDDDDEDDIDDDDEDDDDD